MLATTVDLLHALYRATIAASTPESKRSQIPKPFRWPRPSEQGRRRVTLRDLARRMGA